MRCQMYSLIAILLSTPVFIFIVYYATASQSLHLGSEEKVISDQMNELERSIESDFIRGMKISGRRALISAVDSIVTNGSFLDNSTMRLEELMKNATIYGDAVYVMVNNTLSDWKSKIMDVSSGFDYNISYYNFSIRDNGLNVIFNINLNVNVSHRNKELEIKRDGTFQGIVSIEGIEDPIITINSNGYVRHSFKKYPYSFYAKKVLNGTAEGNCIGNVTFNESSPDDRKILVTHNASGISGFLGVISETDDAPSVNCYLIGAINASDEINQIITSTGDSEIYIDNETDGAWSLPIRIGAEENYYYTSGGAEILSRLENNLSNTSNGISTFINTDELQQVGLPVKVNQSVIDYLYFSNETVKGYGVRGMPDWFKIDIYNADKFNLGKLINYT